MDCKILFLICDVVYEKDGGILKLRNIVKDKKKPTDLQRVYGLAQGTWSGINCGRCVVSANTSRRNVTIR